MWYLFVRRNRALAIDAHEAAIPIEKLLLEGSGIEGPLTRMKDTKLRPLGQENARILVFLFNYLLLLVALFAWFGFSIATGTHHLLGLSHHRFNTNPLLRSVGCVFRLTA
jgi:hypothetical protein